MIWSSHPRRVRLRAHVREKSERARQQDGHHALALGEETHKKITARRLSVTEMLFIQVNMNMEACTRKSATRDGSEGPNQV